MSFLGSLWDTITSLNPFDGDNDSYKDIKLTPTEAPRAGDVISETLLSSNPADTYQGYDLGPQPTSTGFFGSLWDSLQKAGSFAKETLSSVYSEAKEITPKLLSIAKDYHDITKPLDETSLVVKTTSGEIPTQDYSGFTNYQRASSGTQPASGIPTATIQAGGGGLSPTLLIIVGVGALLLFSKKGKIL